MPQRIRNMRFTGGVGAQSGVWVQFQVACPVCRQPHTVPDRSIYFDREVVDSNPPRVIISAYCISLFDSDRHVKCEECGVHFSLTDKTIADIQAWSRAYIERLPIPENSALARP